MKVYDSNDEWYLEVECKGVFKTNPGCYTKLIINGDDIHRYDNVDGFSKEILEKRYAFTCPICGYQTLVPSEIIPDYIKEKADSKKLQLKYYDNIM